MKRNLLSFILSVAATAIAGQSLATTTTPKSPTAGGFIENKGQFRDQYGNTNPEVLFMADLGGVKIQLRKTGFSYEAYTVKPKWVDPASISYKTITVGDNGDTIISWPGMVADAKNRLYHFHRVDVTIIGMNVDALVMPKQKSQESKNYFSRDKKNQGVTINNYSKIIYHNIYPKIDLVFTIDENQKLKYDFIVHPNGKIEDIQLDYQGANNLSLNNNGQLEISTKFGSFNESIPNSWYQNAERSKESVDVKYFLKGSLLTFQANVKKNQTLVIDPSANIFWATYYGDSLDDAGTCLAIDSFNNVYMGGYTSSANNIATSGCYIDSLSTSLDGFVVKFTNDGQRLWGTYLGGFRPNDMDMNPQNQFVITSDSGIIKFDESGFPLWIYSHPNFGKAITYDHDGNIIAVGDSIIKLSSSGSPIWITDYAGTSKLNDVDCDGPGNIYIVGHTTDTIDISTASAHQENYGGGTNAWQGVGVGSYEYLVKSSHGDGMVLKLNPDGSKIWGTYYGGERFDEITSISVSDDGDFAISGLTNSLINISSAGSFQPMLSRNNSIIFMQFTIGGPGDTTCNGQMHVGDTCIDKVYGLPYTNHYQDRDAFIANFDQNGQRKWGTYFGVPASDYASKVITDMNKNVYNISLNKAYSGGPLTLVWNPDLNTWGSAVSPNEPSLYPTNKYSNLKLPTGTNYINLSKFDSLGNRKFTSYFSGTAMPDYPCDPEFSLFQGSLAIDNNLNIFINGKTIFTGGIATEGAFKTNNDNIWVGPNSFAVHDAFLAKFIQGNFETISEPIHTTPCTGDTIHLTLGITTNPLTDFNFQWYKDNQLLAGKTDSILIIPNSSVSDNGYYYCSFMDNGYTWKSDSVNVFVQSEPAFTKVGNDTCHLCEWPSMIQNRHRVPFEEFWTDIDNDSDLDALIVGREKNIWANNTGSFNQTTQNLNQFSELSAAIADYDGDNDLDIVINGDTAGWNTATTILYRNDNGLFNRTNDTFFGMFDGMVKWADMDNDGDQDLVIAGIKFNGGYNVYFYENRKDSFLLKNALYPGNDYGFIEFADYDKDGDLDFLIGGREGSKIYNNSGGNFTNINAGLQGLTYCSGKWGDYDSDGDLDLILNGTMSINGDGDSTILYRNNAGTFERINHQIPSTRNKIHFVDYDNDGDMDVIGGNVLAQNNENNFIEKPSSTPEIHSGIINPHFEPGDYDDEGDMDLLGWNEVYRNDACDIYNTPNLPPSTPDNLSNIVNYDTVHFSWGATTDDKTPQLSLTYNLRVGTTPGGNQVMSSLSDASGWRKIVGMGNVQQDTTWWLKLPEGIYYWSVQAIDNSFAGGSFSDEEAFTIIKHPQITKQPISSVKCPGDSIIISLEADHYFPLTYQWFKNNMIISGATDSIYTKSEADSSDIAQYFCKVSNAFYNTFSDTISIHVEYRPVFVTQPVSSLSNCPGDSISLSVFAESCSPVSYQWFRNNIAIVGATDSLYSKSSVDTTDIGRYFCRLSNSHSVAYSDTIMVDVFYRPYFTLDAILSQGNYQIGDFEGDGDLDLLFADNYYWGPKTQAYTNNLGIFTLSDYLNLNVYLGEKLFADFNSDGKIDVLFFNSDSVRLYLNSGEGLTRYQTSIPNTNNAKVLSGDMDNDGDIDLVIINRGMYNTGASVKILLNEDLNFQEITLNVRHALYGDGLLLDYDNDGDLDIFYTGFHYYWLDPTLPSGNFATILDNDQLQFTPVDQSFYTLEGSSFACDINFDGKTDMLVSGTYSPGWPHSLKAFICDPASPSWFVQQDLGLPNSQRIINVGDIDNNGFIDAITEDYIYYNSNGYFSDSTLLVSGSPGDVDNDGDLDMLAGSEIYQSQNCFDAFNTPPTSPSGLSVSIVDSITHFSWSPALDAQTPQLGLSYNMRVGITPSGSEVMSSMSNTNGYRQIVGFGNVQQNTFWWLKHLSPGTYFWSVQAIDNSFAGSPFAEEQTFTITGIKIRVFPEGLLNTASGILNKSHNVTGEQFSGNVADKITIELHEATAPYNLIGSPMEANLLTNGYAQFVSSAALPESLYIVVKHRNSIETWSALPVNNTNGLVQYDFTQQITSAFGQNLKQVGSVFGLFSGDINQDGIVDALDYIILDNQAANNAKGYLPEDINGDGSVDVFDMLLLENNANEFIGVKKP